MNKMKEVISDIIHTAAQAALTDDEKVARQGLADIYDAIASVLHVDHRAAKPVAPIIPGCPSLGPKVLPSGFDGVEPADNGEAVSSPLQESDWLEFCRLKLVRVGASGQATTFVGKRMNDDTKNPSQIFEIKVRRSNGVFPATATCTENGELLFKLEGSMSFHKTEYAAVKALRAILHHRECSNRDRNRRRNASRAAKRAAVGVTASSNS